jgi:hypothetical protein
VIETLFTHMGAWILLPQFAEKVAITYAKQKAIAVAKVKYATLRAKT